MPLDKDGFNTHKTLLKLWLNPILTKFGWIIVSIFLDDNITFVRYELRHYPENCPGPFRVWFNLFRIKKFERKNKNA